MESSDLIRSLLGTDIEVAILTYPPLRSFTWIARPRFLLLLFTGLGTGLGRNRHVMANEVLESPEAATGRFHFWRTSLAMSGPVFSV